MTDTKHKDFFGRPLYVDDVVAVLESTSHSAQLRQAVIIGASEKMVRVRYFSRELNRMLEASRSPHNVVKPEQATCWMCQKPTPIEQLKEGKWCPECSTKHGAPWIR